jgi:hypothetical protein
MSSGILPGMPDYSQKVAENRLRRMAARRGWTVEKSRSRDPKALDYGLWTMKFEDDYESVLFWAQGTLAEVTDWVEEKNVHDLLKKPPGAPSSA